MQDRAISSMAALFGATPLPTLKAWAAFHFLHDAAPYLAATFADLRARLDQVLQGTTERPSMTGDQRFFLAYAQSRREKTREDDLRRRASRDAHSPGRFRVIGPLRNIDAWYAAFDVAPSDRY